MIQQILFDFDGVIIDSMDVRDYGFRKIVEGHDEALVDAFIKYHRYNAGLSRYVKIRYFYEEMLGQSISEKRVNELASKFSEIMKERLTTPEVIISETVDFIKRIYKRVPLHIVSGSDGAELRFLCRKLNLDKYFVTIEGSPTPKNKLVKDIMTKYKYNSKNTILIGDSVNDYEAAEINCIKFYGYNNRDLLSKGLGYIDSFKSIPFEMKSI
ncbi:MAG TPA: HAD family hydrolase [Arcobacter sp.]|nr:HAD family hydrolase [Arcobacter sp.]